MTKNKNYARGRRYEYKAMDLLKKIFNCSVVVRSAGSKGLIDVVGINDDYTYLVQVKSEKELPKKVYEMYINEPTKWDKFCFLEWRFKDRFETTDIRKWKVFYYMYNKYKDFQKLLWNLDYHMINRIFAGLFVFDRKRKLSIVTLKGDKLKLIPTGHMLVPRVIDVSTVSIYDFNGSPVPIEKLKEMVKNES